jgi:hypothetical protein
MDKVLASVIGFRRVNARVLEELAISHELPRFLVRYHRCQKRLRNIELVIESMQNCRVRPVFSQTSTDHCRLSSVKPRLLDLDMVDDVRSCLPKALRQFCPDARRALSFLAAEAADHVLLGDLRTASRSGCFRNFPALSDGRHFQLLLSFITGVSDYQLCRMFLLDRNAVESILHDFQIRIQRHFCGLGSFVRQPRRMALLRLVGGGVILTGSEAQIWKKGTVHCILLSSGWSCGESLTCVPHISGIAPNEALGGLCCGLQNSVSL